MSRDIEYYVEAYNEETESWEELYLTTKDGQKVSLFGNEGMDTIFGNDSKLHIPRRGFPKGFSDPADWDEYYCTWFDWCEFKALARTPEAVETDWWKMEEIRPPAPYEDWLDVPEELRPHYNDLKRVAEKVGMILSAYEKYWCKPGEVRLVCCLSY